MQAEFVKYLKIVDKFRIITEKTQDFVGNDIYL